MGELVLAHAGPNGAGLIVFLPFLPIAAGLLFIVIAARDKAGRKDTSRVPRLPTSREYPLRAVHVALRSGRPTPSPAADDKQDRPDKRFRPRPRHLKQV